MASRQSRPPCAKVEAFLRKRFSNPSIEVRARPKKTDSAELPHWSEWVDQESNFTKDAWYIVFCDPTLPESTVGGDGSGDVEDLGQ